MKNTFASLKRLARYIKPYKLTFIFVLLFTVLTVAFNAALPYVVGLPTTEISNNIANGESINFDYIFKCLIWITVVGIGYCVSQLLSGVLMTNVVQSAMQDLRRDIEEKINRLPVSYFDKNQQGNILSRVTNDVDAVSGALQQAFIGVVNAILGITMAAVMMFYIQPIMALISMIMIPASIWISKRVINASQKYFQQMQNSLGELNGYVQENMTGFSVLKVYGREQETFEGFKKVNHSLKHYGFKAAFISGLMMPLVQLTAYATYIASAATKRVFEILDEPEEKENKVDVTLPETILGNVSFEHVDFAYDPKKPLIQDLNFEVKAGQTVAVVGPTGAGKTTLINLLMRFYDVTHGAIKIDGIDTKSMSRSDVRSLFGMVLQDAWLYEGTIADNIRFGKLDATDYEVVDAAKTANVDHFIRTMPDGYEMEINSEGDNVSLGQKQLLTIARAVVSDPKILILDEATSSVDTRLEALIQKAMDRVMKGRTSFVIAHRLSTIRDADLILVMDQGQIIEKGTHESLLAQGGFYEKLYNSQFAEEVIEA